MELPFAEAWKIKMVEPIRKSTRQEREQWLAQAIDDLCTEVKAMHSPFHAAAQAAAACADDLSQAPYLSTAAASDPAVLDGREPAAGHDAGAPAPPSPRGWPCSTRRRPTTTS